MVNEKIINEICQLKVGAQTCYKKYTQKYHKLIYMVKLCKTDAEVLRLQEWIMYQHYYSSKFVPESSVFLVPTFDSY